MRSGSGRGGAIIYAQNKGIKVLVDHSIAHPAYMEKHLRNEFEKTTHHLIWESLIHYGRKSCTIAKKVIVYLLILIL